MGLDRRFGHFEVHRLAHIFKRFSFRHLDEIRLAAFPSGRNDDQGPSVHPSENLDFIYFLSFLPLESLCPYHAIPLKLTILLGHLAAVMLAY
jgi:hypothetical protein